MTNLTREHVQDWLDRYSRAWETYDAADIAELFSEDAAYRYHPWDEPINGRDEIVRAWVAPSGNESDRDTPGTYQGRYEAWAVDGNRAVAVGISDYWSDASHAKLERRYYNNWLLEFDDAGRCTSFTEYYMKPSAG